MESKHTKGEWRVFSNDWIYSGKTCVATIQDTGLKGESQANAKRIVTAVNAHAELVENLTRLIDRIEETSTDRLFPSAYNRAVECLNKINQNEKAKV